MSYKIAKPEKSGIRINNNTKKNNDMTKQELNRDIKKLNEAIKGATKGAEMVKNNPTSTEAEKAEADKIYWEFMGWAHDEFKRLHGADGSMKSLTAQSLLTLIVLNRKYRFMSIHIFGLFAEV